MTLDEKVDGLRVDLTRLEGKLDAQAQVMGSYIAFNQTTNARMEKMEGRIWGFLVLSLMSMGSALFSFFKR